MEMKNRKKAAETAENRMAMITPLLAPNLSREDVTNMKERISESFQVSVRTLERYCKSYLEYGFEGLYFDNGSQYRTHWMRRACGLLGIRLLYAKPRNPQGKGKQERWNHTVDSFLEEISLKLSESLSDLNSQFQAWLGECYHSKIHSALGTTPEIAFKGDSMPANFPDAALVARAFPHCEQRKADKSGCVSFRGDKYDLGVRFAGTRVDVVYDAGNTEALTIEAPGEHPFQVHKHQIQEHVAPRAKKRNIDRIPADSSRLLDAACAEHARKDALRRTAISYSAEVDKA